MKNCFLFFVFSFYLSFVISSQNITKLPYFESFENEATYSEWNLQVGSTAVNSKAVNQWRISSAEHFYGNKSLLISSDTVDTMAIYSSSTISMMVAYREFDLPKVGNSKSQTYDLSFMWRGIGESDEAGKVCNDGLYVLWLPATQTISSSVLFDQKYEQMALEFEVYGNKRKFLNSSFEWQNASVKVTASDGVKMKLVFIWRNNNNAEVVAPSACIDNIQLALSKEDCQLPTNLGIVKDEDTKLRLSWQGSSDAYEVMYHTYFDTATVIKSVKNNYYEFTNLPNGLYNFYVRGICLNDLDPTQNDTTVWSVLPEYLIYSALESCVNITDFNSAGTECYYGLHSSEWVHEAKKGVVDYGPQKIESRHTVHFQPYEFDPRTGGELSTVPTGDVVSVRLGNWDRKGNAESVIYTIDVPEDEDMMVLMKYAVVFENPYCKNVQRFQLDILDEKDRLVDPDCGHVEFFADPSSYEWNKYVYTEYSDNGEGSTSTHEVEVLWRDWTTVGVNLKEYAGEQVKIRLTVMDCALKDPAREVGHYGYVYFTLQCASAKIEGISCGENPTTSVIAPEGFDYEWYNVENPNEIISREREMPVDPTDASVYECRCMFPENHDCFFTIEANLAPRYPVAQFIPRWVPESCTNRMQFQSTSVVMRNNAVTGDKIESFYWEFDNGIVSTEESPILNFPDEGGVVSGSLTVGIAGGLCTDVYEFEQEIPTILLGNDTIEETICRGEKYRFAGQVCEEAGEYHSPVYKNQAGCDSIAVLLLTVIDKVESEVYDTIFDGEVYDLNGIKYKKSGDYLSTIPSSRGCDSVITLHLTVLETLEIAWHNVPEICEGDSLFSVYFDVIKGQYQSYDLQFSSNALSEGFADENGVELDEDRVDIKMPLKVRPNTYEVNVILVDSLTKNISVPLNFDIYYSKDIIAQKFDNLLTIKDKENNGGYEFEDNSYQWYKNNEILEGETKTYYYIEGEAFEIGDCFYFEATRKVDGVRTRTCEFCVRVDVGVEDVLTAEELNIATIFDSGELLDLGEMEECKVDLYSMSGQKIYSKNFDNETVSFVVPEVMGVYLLCLTTQENYYSVKIIVK